jgi:CheY-like chemotaxis protein
LAERILIADDSATVRKLVSRVLQFRGYQVVEATSGDEALQVIASQPPDLVILDLRMPGMDGLEVLQRLRESESNADLLVNENTGRNPGAPGGAMPVIILSGEDEERDQSLAAGADRYLGKPFMPGELLDIVRELLGSGDC